MRSALCLSSSSIHLPLITHIVLPGEQSVAPPMVKKKKKSQWWHFDVLQLPNLISACLNNSQSLDKNFGGIYYLPRERLQQTPGQLSCLCRRKKTTTAKQRIKKNARSTDFAA